MASILDLVKHYQNAIEKYPQDEQKVLKCIDKLFGLGVTVQHLQETGVGRTVNALRKEPGDVGQAARSLVYKWKLMVASEESDGEEQNDTSTYNGHGSGKDSDDYAQQSHPNQYEPSNPALNPNEERNMNGVYGSSSKRSNHSHEDSSRKRRKHSSSSDDKYDKKSQHRSSRKESGSDTNEDSDNSQSDDSESEYSDSSHEEVKIKQEFKKEPEDSPKSSSSKFILSPKSSSYIENATSKSSHEPDRHTNHSTSQNKERHTSSEKHSSKDKSHSSSKHSSNSSEKRSSHTSDKHGSHKSDKNACHTSDKHKSSKEKESSSDKSSKSEKSDIDKNVKESTSSKHSSTADKHRSSSSHKSDNGKHKSSSEKHSKSDKHKSSSHSHDAEKEKYKSSSDKESSKHASKKSTSNGNSSVEKHSSSKDKTKERSSSSKDKSDSEKKHTSSSDHKSSSKEHKSSSSSSKRSSDKDHDRSDKSKHKSSSSSHKSSSKSSSHSKKDVPNKKVQIDEEVNSDDGIDCGSGASFGEALGMISPVKAKKKASQLKDTTSPNGDWSPATLLAPTAKLAPLPVLEISSLPEISPNYKPRPPPKALPHFVDDDAMSIVISSKNQRTKVYSGNKVIGKVPSLYELCVQVLQEHIDALEFTGGVPYEILKPVVDKATPNQLYMLEHFNPYLMDDTDHLWKIFCQKSFRTKQRQEMETWREMYARCQEEQEHRLKSLTNNIKIAQEAKKAPIKQTKMAYVDSFAKPPRNVAKKQAVHGTARMASASPAARVASLAAAPNILRGGATARPIPAPSTTTSNFLKPKKAPLMAKALQAMRGRKR